jgi:hypothetical protein
LTLPAGRDKFPVTTQPEAFMSRDEKLLTSIPFDWSRLLGFDQEERSQTDGPAGLRDARLTKVGSNPCAIRNHGAIELEAATRSGKR